MTDFKAKMHQIRFRLAPQTALGELTAPETPLLDLDAMAFAAGRGAGLGKRRERGSGRGGRGKWRGGKVRAPNPN